MKPLKQQVLVTVNNRVWDQVWNQVADRIWIDTRIPVNTRFLSLILSELKEKQQKRS